MTFDEMLEQVIALLKRQGRASYSALKRHFDPGDDYLKDLQDELLYVHPVRAGLRAPRDAPRTMPTTAYLDAESVVGSCRVCHRSGKVVGTSGKNAVTAVTCA